MKLSKLMLSAFVAAAALVACNKENTTPEPSKTLKSIDINIENLFYTKGAAGNKIDPTAETGAPVKLNDLRIYLVDASGNFYTGKTADGTADATSYFDAATVADAIADEISFHYVDTKVDHVIAVGNMGETTYENEAALQAATLAITGAQQDQNTLVLFANAPVEGPDGTHNNDTQNGNVQENQRYTAELTLKPRVARFEVDGFNVEFEETPIYSEIKFTQLAVVNYYDETNLYTGADATLVNPLASYYNATTVLNETAIYSWLATKPENTPAWTYDVEDLVATPEAPVVDFATPRAYHVFATAEATPVFFIHLLADGVPAFLYTKNFKNAAGDAVTEFKEGYIYRMSAATEAGLKDGNIPVPEDKINPMDRCLDITVEVEEWVVEVITPEF